MSNTTQKK